MTNNVQEEFEMERMQELVELLNYYRELYYTKDAPIVSDAEFDKLYDELLALEKSTGIILKNSPTRIVGGETNKKFEQSTHLKRLYSLDKCQSFDELEAWMQRLKKTVGFLPEFTAEYKFDGLTINVLYENGILVKASTRGNGEVGENVTEQVKTISNVPKEIEYKGRIEVQGEGIMRLSALNKYNLTAKDPLKNARNAVAGAIRNLDPKVTKSRNLDVFFYNIGYSEKEFASQIEMRNFIVEQGFEVGGDFELLNSKLQAEKYADNTEANRDSLDYLIDGIVFKVNDSNLREQIGYTEKFPKWAIAFKFKPDEMTTILKDVVWQVSRTSKLNPLAILQPVDIAGVTVQRATLNNFQDIQKKKVKIGDRVFIRRSNDVIPEITGVAVESEDAVEIEKPTVCPACGSLVESKGAFLYCTNQTDCAPQIVSKLTHFASKGAMNIDGLSDKTCELLYNELAIKEFYQLYALKNEDLEGLEGFGEKKIKNLIDSIQKSKNSTLDRLLYAVGIMGIGKKSAKDLANKFETLQNIMQGKVIDFLNVDGVGEILAQNIEDFFANQQNVFNIEKLLENGVVLETQKTFDGVFSGEKLVLTGSLKNYKRSQAQQLIVENGGETSDTISKTVTLVVAGEDAGSKLSKAESLNIRIIDEEEFEKMLKK